MKIHTAFEHALFEAFDHTPHHQLLLDRLNKAYRTELLTLARRNGKTSLRATQHVGVLRLGNTTLQILPKMHRNESSEKLQREEATRNLLLLLSYALDLPTLEHHAAHLARQSHDWLEILTHLFAKNLRTHFHESPHRHYQTFHDDLPLLRGKLRIADQLRRPDRQHLFACTFDEFSIDNPLNRVFRFVVERLFFLSTSSTNRQLLGELRDMLDPVTLPTHLTFTEADPARLISRLNIRYRPLLQLARLFLSDETPQLTTGSCDTFNFLFDMNQLFESFVAGFIRKHHNTILQNTPLHTCILSPQARGHRHHLATDSHDSKKHFQLIPDLTFSDSSGSYPLLLDTKYKSLDQSHRRFDVAPADFYQMFAYAHRYNSPHVLLLYPQTADMPAPLHKSFRLDDTPFTITVATLNLTQDLTTTAGRNTLIQELHILFSRRFQPPLVAPPV